MVGADWVTVLEGFTDRTRQYRKMGNQALSTRAVQGPEYTKVIEDETHAMVQRVLEHPNQLLDAIK